MNKRITTILLLCMILLTVFAALYHITPAKASAQIILLAHRGFYLHLPPEPDRYHVVGEIKNVGDTPANSINFSVTFYNSKGFLLGSQPASVLIDCVRPGTRAPFRATLSGQYIDVDHYNITSSSIKWSEFPQGKPLELQIQNSTFYRKKDGWNYTVGIVKNNGSANATDVLVTVIYHNKTTGDIFWASRSTTTPTNALLGEKVSFEVNSFPSTIPFGRCNVTVVAESDEYLSLPFTDASQDKIKPLFGEILWFPTSPSPSNIVGVNVTVTKPDYATKVENVTLFYRPQGGSPKSSASKSHDGDLWRFIIETFGAGQVVEFWFEAVDEAGNKQTSKLSYYTVQGQASGVPIEILIIVLIALILVGVVYKYRKRLF